MRRTYEGWGPVMRLTRRGKLVAALLVAALAYLWMNVEPIYGDCRQTIEGEVCILQGYEWKGSK
jgi:hypothetical protein